MPGVWRTSYFGVLRPSSTGADNVGGRRVAGLFEGRPDPGWYVVDWSGLDDGGSRVAAGVYFLRFDAGSVRETRKIVQLR